MSSTGLGVDLQPFLPELLLTGGILLLLILNLLFRGRRGTMTAIGGTLVLAVAGIVAITADQNVGGYLFNSVVQDGVTVFFRVFFCVATAFSLGLLVFGFREDGEPYLLVLSGVLGMFLLAGANDIVTLFVALELVSIPSYVLAGYRRHNVRSAEAALKYMLYGAMSSGLLIFGLSYIYGLTSTTNITEIVSQLGKNADQQNVLFIALLLVLAGIGYKIAMVPMHFWCPDVYEGSPTPVTAFFSVVPKAAGFAALYRLMPIFLPLHTDYGMDAVWLFTAASAVTMTFGNLGAIWQTSLKRLLAYSSIAHAGYILMGFAVIASHQGAEIDQKATTGILFYLATYLFMNLGAFFVVDLVERHRGGKSIHHFKGLGKTATIPALLLAVFLFSLTGIPPFAGFTGKFLLFAALVSGKLWALAIIGILNTVISLYYYIRVVRDMFIAEPDTMSVPNPQPIPLSRLAIVISLGTLIPTLVLGLWWGWLAEWIQACTKIQC